MKTLAALVLALATLTAYGQQYITAAGSLPGYGLSTVTATDTGNASGSATTTVTPAGNFSMNLIRNDTYNFAVTAGIDAQHPAFAVSAVKLVPSNLATTAFDLTTIFAKASMGTPSAAVLTEATGLPLTTGVTGILPIANGGTGTTTPGLVQGSGISVSGTWPNQTVTNTGVGGTSNPTTCTSNTSTTKCLGVSPYLAVSGDWSAAINQAVTDLASTGGVIYGCGVYPVNGSLLDPTGANAIIKMPSIASVGGATTVTIEFLGCQPTTPNAAALSGMTLQTSVNTSGGNFIAGYATGSTFGNFTAVKLVLEHTNIISTVAAPNLNLLNATWTNALSTNDVVLGGTGCGATPVSSTGGIALQTPAISNNYEVTITKTTIGCMPQGAILREHAAVSDLWLGEVHDCVQFDAGGSGANSITAQYIWAQGCVNYAIGAAAGHGATAINVQTFDMESDPGTGSDINDPNNLLTGFLGYQKQSPSGLATITGATNLTWKDMASGTGATVGGQTITVAGNQVLTLDSADAVGTFTYINPRVTPNVHKWVYGAAGTGIGPNAAGGLYFGDLTAGVFTWLQHADTATLGAGYIEVPYKQVNCWSANADLASTACDTGLSRDAAGAVDVGNGAQGDKSGTVNAAHFATGSSILYRCTTAGTLPVGALTVNTSNCGASVDTGLKVN